MVSAVCILACSGSELRLLHIQARQPRPGG